MLIIINTDASPILKHTQASLSTAQVIEYKKCIFPNQEQYIKYLQRSTTYNVIDNLHCFILQDFYPNPDEKLIEAILIGHKFQASKPILVTPCLPYTRQDKQDNPYSTICKTLLNYFQKIITIDVHNAQIFPKKIINASTLPISSKIIQSKIHNSAHNAIILVSPDNSIKPKAQSLAHALNCSYLWASKSRNFQGKISNFQLHNLEQHNLSNMHCIIIDDILDTGQTLSLTTAKLKQHQAKDISIIVTHGFFSILPQYLLDNCSKIHVANTLISKVKHKTIHYFAAHNLLTQQILNLGTKSY